MHQEVCYNFVCCHIFAWGGLVNEKMLKSMLQV